MPMCFLLINRPWCLRLLLLSIIALFFLIHPHVAHAWSPAIQITTSAANSLHPAAVVDQQGRLHIAWYEATGAGGSGVILYTAQTTDDAAPSWSSPTILSDHADAVGSAWVRLAVTPANELMALWLESDYRNFITLYYRVRDLNNADGDWSAPTVLSTHKLSGFPSLATHGTTLYAVWPISADDDSGTGDGYADTILLRRWQAGTWSPPEALPLETGTFDIVNLAIDAQGHLHLTWNGNRSGPAKDLNKYDIYYATYDGGGWSVPVNLSQTTTYSFWPVLAVDSAGAVHLLWLEALIGLEASAPVFQTIYYQRQTDGVWLAEPIKLNSYSGVVFPAVQHDPQGRVHFTWSENTNSDPATFHFRTRYTQWDGARLLPAIQVSDLFPQSGHVSSALTALPNGDRWLVWSGGDDTGAAQIFAAHQSANQLSLAGIGSLADHPEIVGDSQDRLHTIWSEGIGESFIAYSRRTGERWASPQRVTPVGLNSRYGILAVDPQDQPHIVFYGAPKQGGSYVYYTTLQAGTWISPTLISQADPRESPLASTPHLAVDQTAQRHVVWQALPDTITNDFAIYYRQGSGNTWGPIAQLSPPGQAANAPRIAVDAAGNPHVVWYAVDEQEIYYIRRSAAGWTVPINLSQTNLPIPKQTVLTQGPDLAIDPTGYLHVGWLESTNGSYFDAVYYATNQGGLGDSSGGERWQVQAIMADPRQIRDMERQSGNVVRVLVGAGGQIHLLWHDVDQAGQPTIFHSRRQGEGWSSPTILLSGYQSAQNPAGYLDAQEQLHLVWSELQAVRQVFYQRFDRFNWVKVVDVNGDPLAGSQVFQNGALVGVTDQRGLYLPPTLQPNDQLAVLTPVDEFAGHRNAHGSPDDPAGQWAYRLYWTNWQAALEETPQPWRVTKPTAEQRIVMHQRSPLVLFNLVVSVEWRATAAYLADLAAAMQAASNYLYDLTDGQMAFGHVAIYDNARHWGDADIQIMAKNNVRPYAYVNGIRATDRAYVMRLGRHWDGGSGATGAWSAPNGYRTLVHEFGHYALGLYDEYFGYRFDTRGNLLGEVATYCIGLENRAPAARDRYGSAMDYQYNTSEFSAFGVPGLWSTNCTETRHWYEHQTSVWESWVAAYADRAEPPRWSFYTPMQRGAILNGPDAPPPFLPGLPAVTLAPADTLEPPPPQTVQILESSGAPLRARVTLYANSAGKVIAIDQGITDADGRIVIYGGRPGDRIYGATLAGGLTGQLQLGNNTLAELVLRSRGTVTAGASPDEAQTPADTPIRAPYLLLRAEPAPTADAATLHFSLYNVADDTPLTSFMIPPGTDALAAPSLTYVTTTATYQGAVALETVRQGTGSLRVFGLDAGNVVDLYNPFQLHALRNDQISDLFAADGALSVHLEAASVAADNSYLVIQPLLALPAALPDGLTLVGLPYQLTASGADLPLTRSAVLKFHLTNRQFQAEETGLTERVTTATALQLRWWDPAAAAWQPLPAVLDVERQELTTVITQWGLYAVTRAEPAPVDSIYLPFVVR